MDARLFERLYGFRLLFFLFILITLFACLISLFKFQAFLDDAGVTEIGTFTPSKIALSTPTKALSSPSPASGSTNKPTTTQSINDSPTAVSNATSIPTPSVVLPGSPDDLVVCTGIANGFLNFRSTPSTYNSAIIDYLSEGKKVLFVKDAGTFFPWSLINVDGVQGYAYSLYLCKP